MRNTQHDATPTALNEGIVYGRDIDHDLKITDRGRRKLIKRGVLPEPDGYFCGRSFWRVAKYAAFKADLLAGKFPGRGGRRPGVRNETR